MLNWNLGGWAGRFKLKNLLWGEGGGMVQQHIAFELVSLAIFVSI